jgi:hypothetical protein
MRLIGFNGGAKGNTAKGNTATRNTSTINTPEGDLVLLKAAEADKLFKEALLAELNKHPDAVNLKQAAAAARNDVVELMKLQTR